MYHITRLNPCFNGRYSLRNCNYGTAYQRFRLNPCFNGRYSLRTIVMWTTAVLVVLILVLMEDTHWVPNSELTKQSLCVLILVLMEDTHWGSSVYALNCGMFGLNPCFNGRYSLSTLTLHLIKWEWVLILVLMEDTHWERQRII